MITTTKIRDTATLYLSIDKIVDLGGISFARVREFIEDGVRGDIHTYYELIEIITDVVPNPDFEECDQARFDTAQPYELYDGEHLIEFVRLNKPDDLPEPQWELIRSEDRVDRITHKGYRHPTYYAFNTLGL